MKLLSICYIWELWLSIKSDIIMRNSIKTWHVMVDIVKWIKWRWRWWIDLFYGSFKLVFKNLHFLGKITTDQKFLVEGNFSLRKNFTKIQGNAEAKVENVFCVEISCRQIRTKKKFPLEFDGCMKSLHQQGVVFLCGDFLCNCRIWG